MARALLVWLLLSAVVGGVQGTHSDGYLQAFYHALNIGNLEAIVDLFAPDGIYSHTGVEAAYGPTQLRILFKKMFDAGIRVEEPTMVDIQMAGETNGAQAFIATRRGFLGEGAVRDSFFVVNGKIQVMMTTKADPKDPLALADLTPVMIASTQTHDPAEEDAVRVAVDKYFDGFVSKNPKQMQSAFVEHPFYMFDFSPHRKTPFGCSQSEDCGTAPYFSSSEKLLHAFQSFCNGYVNLNHKFELIGVYGDLALASTLSFGCEGENVTPNGSMPMPNHEMFVLVKGDGMWKIHSYMSTYAPRSSVQPPASICPPPFIEEPKCVVNASVGICAYWGCFENHGSATCQTTSCICDPGSCSYDGLRCVPIPTTTTTTMTSSTITTTRPPYWLNAKCDTRAIVGLCLVKGCFWAHGNAHCDGTKCICDEGSCSQDGWTCVSQIDSPQLASAPIHDELSPGHGLLTFMLGGSLAAVVALVGFKAIGNLLARRSVSMTQSLLG